jgi:SulP family sulfate permease
VTAPTRARWLPRFERSSFAGDLAGGVTAAIVALPLALAFGVASGAGPAAGLYGAICCGLFAALFGGTPAQISGPTGPMTVVSAAIFTAHAGNPAVAFTIVMLAGLLQVVFGWLRLGRYINLVPYPVVSGFMSGIGVIIIVMQLDPLLGHPPQATVVNALSVLPADVLDPRWHAIAAGLTALGICVLMPRALARYLPATLAALLAGTLLVAFAWTEAPVLGPIPGALPELVVPQLDWRLLNDVIPPALALAALGSIDSLLTSLVADNATRTFHDSDRELVGQGIGNLAAGLAGGLPGAGATIRTLVNIRSGGRTWLAGAVHALVLLAIALGLGPLAAHVPHAVLAGILIKVGIDVIDWRYLQLSARLPVASTACMLTVLLLTVFVDVITAVAIGTVMASLLFVREMADLQSRSIRTITDHASGEDILAPAEREILQQLAGRLLLLHLSGAMSFGAANEMTRRIARTQRVEALLIDMQDVPLIDVSAALALETIIERAREDGQQVLICGVRQPVADALRRIGLDRRLEGPATQASRLEALRAVRELLAGKPG